MKKIVSTIFIIFLIVPLISFSASGPTLPETGLPSAGVKDILENILTWLLGIVGILALISFAVSGVMYLISAGDSDMADKAKDGLKYSIYGIVVVLSAFVVIRAVDFALRASSGI